MTAKELDDWLARSLAYDRYLDLMTEQANQATDDLDAEAAERVGYTKLNLHRTLRIGRTYKVAEELVALMRRLTRPQTWLVLTEPWCGDSAQCLPHLAVLSDLNKHVTLRILLRDENLDVMDRYLTEGKRSIPRLVAFDEAGTELFTWGPRPAAAQAVFAQAQTAGLAKPDLLEKLHLFYGRDRGRALEAEFIELLTAHLGRTR